MASRKRQRPRPPRLDKRPKDQYGPDRTVGETPPDRSEDPEVWKVRDQLLEYGFLDSIPDVIRETFDQIYDGQRTGRWDYDQLGKTEKTHIGTLVQINLQKEFEISDGDNLDYQIAGVEVDCKWSRILYDWEIPKEMYSRGSRLALLLWGSDYTSRWATGLLRIDESVLKPEGKQRDRKRRINDLGRRSIMWLGEGGLVANTLLHLSDTKRKKILGFDNGQRCVDELFREMTGELVNRATVLTVAQQDDSLKRVRDSRKHLKGEGIVIFGHYAPHPALAEQLGLPRPTQGRFVSTRLVPATDSESVPTVTLEDRLWRIARPGDPVQQAPRLPVQGQHAE